MRTLVFLLAILTIITSVATDAAALQPLQKGDWVRYKILRASEWIPAPAEYVSLVIGNRESIGGRDAYWWQMAVEKEDGTGYVVQALSDHAPMTKEDGDVGRVYRYIFRQQGCPTLEYTDQATGLAYLPLFGFREGLIPTPRSSAVWTGAFLATGNFLGQALAVSGHGTNGEWLNLEPIKQLVLNDDLLIGTARWVKDDGTGKKEDGDYTYVELEAKDYDEMIKAGFNIFMVNNKHLDYVRDRAVFFVKGAFAKNEYPELLYRSNFCGPAMFTDEPAIRMNALECRTPQDAANLLRLRNYAYHRSPGSAILDPRFTQADGIVQMIHQAGYSVGDWLPLQRHVPVWETIYESAFYQLEGGAAGIVHEGRYELAGFNNYLQSIIGPGAEVTTEEMYTLVFNFMRGAARCFGGEWGTAIYGQADYSIAPQAIKQAYDMGARYIWFWTSDHDHHLPYTKQLELARIIRDYELANPRASRVPQIRKAKVAVAIPDGYICVYPWMWGNPWFGFDKLNEFGVTYGSVISEAYYQMYRLVKAGIDFDCIIDVPKVIESAGYDRIIRIRADGCTNLPAPALPSQPLKASLATLPTGETYTPRPDAPKVTARSVKAGDIVIDGDTRDWRNVQWIRPKKQFTYELSHEKWGGEADLDAKFAFAYDNRFVYIAAEVRDDVHVANRKGGDIWLNDSIQIAFDPLFNPHTPGNYAPDDSEIGFSLVDGKPIVYRWTQWVGGLPGEVPGAEVAIVRKGDLTIYEARVPFTDLSPLTPSFPGRCGVNVVVNDADTEVRKGALAWTEGVADPKCPSCFGVLVFAGAERMSGVPAMAFVQSEKTVVKRGEPVLLRVDTGSVKLSKGELTVTLRHRDRSLPATVVPISIPSGMACREVRLETLSIEPDSYDLDLTLRTGDVLATKQSVRIYVTE